MLHISCFILRYLCGQVSKASQDLSFVGFIHNTFSNHEPEGGSDHMAMNLNSLKTSLNLWQAYGTTINDSVSVTADNESLWELIHQHQEWIYSKVRSKFLSYVSAQLCCVLGCLELTCYPDNYFQPMGVAICRASDNHLPSLTS